MANNEEILIGICWEKGAKDVAVAIKEKRPTLVPSEKALEAMQKVREEQQDLLKDIYISNAKLGESLEERLKKALKKEENHEM